MKREQFTAGQKIDMLTLIRIVEERKYKRGKTNIWECKCDCGKVCTITETSLAKHKHYHSCGCYTLRNLHAQPAEHLSKAGKARAQKRNKNGINVDMLFRSKPIKTNTSGIQGVSWSNTAHKWHVYIGYKQIRANLGFYDSLEFAKQIRERGIDAVKNGTFEEYYESIRGKKLNVNNK